MQEVKQEITKVISLLQNGGQSTQCINKRQKDCLWKQKTHYGLENRSLGFTETLHKQ